MNYFRALAVLACAVLSACRAPAAGSVEALPRLALADLRPGTGGHGRELFVLAPPLLVDNHEGLAGHRRADGRGAAYLLAVLLP